MQYHQNTNEDLALASRLQRQDTSRFFLHVLQDDSSAMPFKKLSRSEKSAWMADASELGGVAHQSSQAHTHQNERHEFRNRCRLAVAGFVPYGTMRRA